MSKTDSTQKYITTTDTAGHFTFLNIYGNGYTLQAIYLGYGTISKTVMVNASIVDLGTLVMSESAIPMEEVVIEQRVPTAVQKGDTTEYNARAFKMNRDATAEDLVTKMPGVTVENGTVKAQGEDVQQVLVDGRQFFGSDPTLSLRNLPSEIIDKVQVFDKLSDQAQLTGFDDGQSIKTLNIVTRPERRHGEFGRFNGGYGTDDRYIASGSVNSFQADRRLSLIGLSDNINQQNFSTQDLLGVMSSGSQRGGPPGGGMFGGGRRPGSGMGGVRAGGGPASGGNVNNFLVGQQNGITSVHSLGLNDADSLAANLYMNGSYFFNLTDNNNPQTLSRQYFVSSDSSSQYNENSTAERKNYNHRLNFRFEYTADSSNSFIVTPQFYLQNNRSTSSVSGVNLSSAGLPLSQSQNDNTTNTNGYTSQNHLIYRHKFPTLGRTTSVDFGIGSNRKQSTGNLYSLDQYENNQLVRNDTINQQSDILTNGYSFSSSVIYTEPIGTKGLLQANYNTNYSKSSSDNKTYNFNQIVNDYSDLNSKLSNAFENDYFTNSAGLGYRFRGPSFNATMGVSYQIAALRSQQSFPISHLTTKAFYSLLPNVMLNYELSTRRSLRVFYRTSTTLPTISQLQNVVDNTNPLLLSTGNPDLKQSYSHTLLSRLSLANTESAQSILLFFYASYTRDYIGNSTVTAQRDTLLAGGIRMNQGIQLTAPINLDGYWNLRFFSTYGLPVDFLKSNLNLNAGFTYTQTPGLINGIRNLSNLYVISPGFVLGSNISEDLDFTLSYSANINSARNTVQSEVDNNYFTHTAGLKFNWIFWQGIVLRNEMSNSLSSGLTDGLNQNSLIWNISLGKKFFNDQRGEILLTVYDLLNQNKSVNRTVTETYIEDTRTQVLNRYFVVTFTYNLRQFGETKSGF